MSRFSRILNDAIFLCAGLVAYSMLAFGAFQHFFYAAAVVWMLILAILGYQIHRKRWKTFATTAAVIGLGSVLFFLGCIMLALTSSTPMPLTRAFSSGGELFLTIYIPFFWLPFALGAVTACVVPPLANNPGTAGSHQ
ncbi:hypothetical protein [Luteolibacter soli]|uniref:Uncharacterized protein n=1 Tax=Luteolibacter soli TaxID=3135280 RepID=A0ABU9AU49_9BACT